MTLASGTRLGPYEVRAPLGEGGMGQVYRARDGKLDRDVAIKVLPEAFARDPERLARFRREARVLATLKHPHIAAIYGLEEAGGIEAIVLELVEGETLSARLARGALPLEQALAYGVQIAEALDAAHRQGIVHRDLKPGNVMLARSGVKLLDFGLAKWEPEPRHEVLHSLSEAPTRSEPLTHEGALLGTFQYMAPEQLQGQDADARSDIFAFGAVLYEMATGRKAFTGASQVSVMSAILKDEPEPISRALPSAPTGLDRLLGACFAKNPDDRWQSAADLARELGWVMRSGPAAPAQVARPPVRARRGLPWLPWAVAGFAVLVGAGAYLIPRSAPPADLTRFTIAPPSGQLFMPLLRMSPDSRRLLLFVEDEGGRRSVYVRSLDSLQMRRLPGTEDSNGMFWSPDGREVAFFSEGKLKRMSADGGPIQTICESGGAFSGAWGPDGTVLFSPEFGQPIVAVPASGGASRPVTTLDPASEATHIHPAFLPDGRHFVYVARGLDLEKTSVMLASLDSKEVRRLFPSDSSAVYADPGYFLFSRDSGVFAWRFDPSGLRLQGNPTPAFEQVHCMSADNLLSLSAAGRRVAYLSWALRRRLVWVDRAGRELGSLGEIGGYVDVRLSPDGRRVAVARRDPGHAQNMDVWVLDAARGTATRVSMERTDEFNPAWFPDGEHLVYVSEKFGFYDLFTRPAAGGAEQLLLRSEHDKLMPTVLPDGRHLFVSILEKGNFSRYLVALSDPKDAVRLSADARVSEEHAEISPDARWTAFDSRESGQREVYVQPLSSGPKRQVSVRGGQMPVWNRNGAELFYAAPDGMLMSVALRPAGGRMEAAEPRPLFLLQPDLGGELSFHSHPYDVSPDGQRFLVIRRAPGTEADGVVVVTNWTAALEAGHER